MSIGIAVPMKTTRLSLLKHQVRNLRHPRRSVLYSDRFNDVLKEAVTWCPDRLVDSVLYPFLMLLILSGGTMLIGGCAITDNSINLKAEARRAELTDKGTPFHYKKKPIQATTTLIEENNSFALIKVEFPANFQGDPDNTTVTAWYYKVKGAAKRTGAIVQLPILGGDYGPAKLFAEFYAKRGYHVLRFERKSNVFDPGRGLERSRHVLQQSVIDVRRGVDWWLTQPEIDPSALGICGISMGGFQSSLVLGVDNRFRAAALLLNGGNLPRLITVSREGEIVDFRNALKQEHGWDDEQLYQEATKVLGDVDPISVAANIDPGTVLFVPCRFDQVVPYPQALEWYEAAHHPRRMTLPTGHYSSVFALPYILDECDRHFRETLGLDG